MAVKISSDKVKYLGTRKEVFENGAGLKLVEVLNPKHCFFSNCDVTFTFPSACWRRVLWGKDEEVNNGRLVVNLTRGGSGFCFHPDVACHDFTIDMLRESNMKQCERMIKAFAEQLSVVKCDCVIKGTKVQVHNNNRSEQIMLIEIFANNCGITFRIGKK